MSLLPPPDRSRTFGTKWSRTQQCSKRKLRGLRLWLAGKHDVVPVAEDKNLRRAPNNAFQVYHGPHAQPKLPQQQVLNEVERYAPCPEGQLSVTDRDEATTAQLADKQIGATAIVARIFTECGDAAIVMLSK